jgi:hypothetical protein
MVISADVILAAGGEENRAEARRALERHGFSVQDAGTSLIIEGEPETFERALGVKLEVKPDPAPGEAIATASGEPQVPEELRGLVGAVGFPKRAHLFGQPPGTRRESHG